MVDREREGTADNGGSTNRPSTNLDLVVLLLPCDLKFVSVLGALRDAGYAPDNLAAFGQSDGFSYFTANSVNKISLNRVHKGVDLEPDVLSEQPINLVDHWEVRKSTVKRDDERNVERGLSALHP